jgi:hypothetical protein
MTNYEGNTWKIKAADEDKDFYAYNIMKDESTGMFTAYNATTGETSALNSDFRQLIAELGRRDGKDYSQNWYASGQ